MKCNFGQLFQTCLERSGYTQKKAAKVLNVSPQTINSYIQGRSIPNIDTFDTMMKHFGLDLIDVFEDYPLAGQLSEEEILELSGSLNQHQNLLLKAVLLYFHMVNTKEAISIEKK